MSILVSIAAAASSATDEAAAGSLPQLDMYWWPSQLFWLAVTFGILYLFMANRFLPRLGGKIEERRDQIADDLDQASEFKRQAEDAETAYNQSLADAKAKAQGIAAETRAEVDAEIADMQAETDASLQNKLEQAEARISEMTRDAAATVNEAASDATRAIVEHLIDEAPNDDAIARAITNAAR